MDLGLPLPVLAGTVRASQGETGNATSSGGTASTVDGGLGGLTGTGGTTAGIGAQSDSSGCACGSAADDRYAVMRYALERKGLVIGAYDMQIAAIALSCGLTVVTHNVGEFSRVPGLVWEDWES